MFRLVRSISLKQCFTEQLPALVGSACIAEAFYKFHSFVLECRAFLATWFVLDLLIQCVACGFRKMGRTGHAAPRARICGIIRGWLCVIS